MKQILKTLGKTVAIVAGTFALVNFVMDAWDNTMTDTEIIQYLNEHPNEKKLQRLAEKRGLIKNDEIVNGKWIAGAPEFVYYDGHCDFENEDCQRGQETFDYAMMVYDENDESIDFKACLKIAEEIYSK